MPIFRVNCLKSVALRDSYGNCHDRSAVKEEQRCSPYPAGLLSGYPEPVQCIWHHCGTG